MNPESLNRREFLSALAASGIVLGLGDFALATNSPNRPEPGIGFEKEASRLTLACMNHFWDSNSKMFRAPQLSAETVPSDELHDRGYTFWPSLVALHALIEGEKAHPGQYTGQIAMVYDGLEEYYSEDLRAYSSWLHFSGNIDAYFDDNSWAVIVLVEASMACSVTAPARAVQYLARASSVMKEYVVKGFDTSDSPGGTRWGTDSTKSNTSDRGTSSTAGSALAAMMLARAGVEPEFYTQWGLKLLNWLTTHLLDRDDLIMDALTEPDWAMRRIKWTYNTGVPLRAYVEHYRLTKSADSLAMATRLARAALNQAGGLFDSKVQDPSKRYYWDGTYFVHYLIDGLLQLALVTKDRKLASEINTEVQRTTRYVVNSLKDPNDGFYWRNMRLYAIGEDQLVAFQLWTMQKITPEYDASERSQDPRFATLEVKERPLVKTLLANAGAARHFWLASRLPGVR